MVFIIWTIALGIQLIIAIVLSIQFNRYKEKKVGSTPFISVVIAAHNEYENLKKLIPCILNQEYPNFEVIVSLDRTHDNSQQLLSDFKSPKLNWLNIQEVPKNFNEKKYALTKAIEKSSGEWVLFTDADCYPSSPLWMSEIASRMPKKDIILGYSPYKSEVKLLQLFIQFEAFLNAFHYLSTTLIGKPYMGVGRNMAIKKAYFSSVGGYHGFEEKKGGDDDLFIQKYANRNNTAIVIGEKSMVFTYPQKNWRNYIKQKTRHLSVGSDYTLVDQILHVIFNSTLFLFWLFLPLSFNKTVFIMALSYFIIKGISYHFAAVKMGTGFNYLLLPCVDVMYAILLPLIAIRSKLKKDIGWKN